MPPFRRWLLHNTRPFTLSRQRINCTLIVLLLVCWLPEPSTAQALQQSAKELIAQLGDADPDLRTQAEAALIELGESATEAVEANLQSDDNEIRLRCKRLIVKIRTRAAQTKRTRFLEADIDDMSDGGFRSWPTFRNATSSSQSARRLFLSIDEQLNPLFQLINEETCPDLVRKAKSMTLYAVEGQASTTMLSAFVLANIVEHERNPDLTMSNVKKNEALAFIQRPLFTNAWKDSESSREIQQLISFWLNSVRENEKLSRNEFQVIYTYELSGLVESLDSNWDEANSSDRLRWFDCAQNGLSTDELGIVTNKFDDDSDIVSTFGLENPTEKMEVQIRDLALLTAVRIAKQNPLDFGFVETVSNFDFSSTSLMGFDDNETRESAFKQFAQAMKVNTAIERKASEEQDIREQNN
jgi:hypothetical protein